jgi:hypothetical protein
VDHDGIAGTRKLEQFGQAGPIEAGAGLLVHVDVFVADAGSGQGVEWRSRDCLVVDTRA